MTTDPHGEIQGTRMTDEETADFLREQGFGVLSLTDGEEAYGLPVSFGYDDGTLYFVFLRLAEESKKERFAQRTERASLTVYDVTGKHEWRSVIASGPLHEIEDDEWQTLERTIGDNAWYPSLFSESDPMRDIQGWVLRIDELTGLKNE